MEGIIGFAVGLALGFFFGWRICQKKQQENGGVTLQVPPSTGGNGEGKPK